MENSEVLKIVLGCSGHEDGEKILDWCREHPDWWVKRIDDKEMAFKCLSEAVEILSGAPMDFQSRAVSKLQWRMLAAILFKEATGGTFRDMSGYFRKDRTTLSITCSEWRNYLRRDKNLQDKYQKLTIEYQKLWEKYQKSL